LIIVAQFRRTDSHQKKPIRLTYPCSRRRRNRPVYTFKPEGSNMSEVAKPRKAFTL